MRCILILLLAGLSSTAADDGVAEERKRNRWIGFGVGSWIIQDKSVTRNGFEEIDCIKTTITEAKPGKSSVALETVKEGKTPGKFDGGKSTHDHFADFDPGLCLATGKPLPDDQELKLIKTEAKELTIQKKPYACTVKTFSLTCKEWSARFAYWYCKDIAVPSRILSVDPRALSLGSDVLRVDVEYKDNANTEMTTAVVTDFSYNHKVGNKKLKCIEEEITALVTGKGSGKWKAQNLYSDEVPGRIVYAFAEGEIDGEKIKKTITVKDFEVVQAK